MNAPRPIERQFPPIRRVGIAQLAQYLRDFAGEWEAPLEGAPTRLTNEEVALLLEAADVIEALDSALHETSLELETTGRRR